MGIEGAMSTPEEVAKKEKIRKEETKRLIDQGADCAITGIDDKLAEKLQREHEAANCPNLETFIRLHKWIKFPHEEMSKELQEEVNNKKGLFVQSCLGGRYLDYVDSMGNIAGLYIKERKIESYMRILEDRGEEMMNHDELADRVTNELVELGFVNEPGKFPNYTKEHESYFKRRFESPNKPREEEFDF
jgi:hypothetical protein